MYALCHIFINSIISGEWDAFFKTFLADDSPITKPAHFPFSRRDPPGRKILATYPAFEYEMNIKIDVFNFFYFNHRQILSFPSCQSFYRLQLLQVLMTLVAFNSSSLSLRFIFISLASPIPQYHSFKM